MFIYFNLAIWAVTDNMNTYWFLPSSYKQCRLYNASLQHRRKHFQYPLVSMKEKVSIYSEQFIVTFVWMEKDTPHFLCLSDLK